jgi:3-phosphoshikimate 1-carboxyvinyltransferase
MNETVSPAKSIEGVITLPGDKSISHRYGMLGGIAQGVTTIHNYSTGADCQSTLGCMAALGAPVERSDGKIIIHGGALRAPAGQLDAGNSGSTIRMLSGILAAQPFNTRIGGDESLWAAMDIIRPLRKARAIEGRQIPAGVSAAHHPRANLHGIDYTLPMASAQVAAFSWRTVRGRHHVREPVRAPITPRSPWQNWRRDRSSPARLS